MSNLASEAKRFAADQAFKAVLALIVARLEDARVRLETASSEKFQTVQGEVKALRSLVQDLSGQKHG